jgi:hypothetical protein
MGFKRRLTSPGKFGPMFDLRDSGRHVEEGPALELRRVVLLAAWMISSMGKLQALGFSFCCCHSRHGVE